ncbi:MAG: BatA domain-containing protein [Candidatus Hydrogenedentes bacterium]|nr:BatA domain-containing protein [Candidatus Hydrogenedentota bacterium]
MSFALPLGLLFFGLFIPIAALYLLKQRRDRSVAPTLLFWDEALQSNFQIASWNRIRKWLSLLMQLLIVALLTLALAQPLLSSALLEGRRIVLLLDASASMATREGEQTRLDLAKEHGRALVQGLGAGDAMMIVQVGSRPAPLTGFTNDGKTLLTALEHAAQEYGTADFEAAAELLDYLPQDTRATVVYVVSDGAWEPVAVKPQGNTTLAWHTVGTARDNAAITQFSLRPLSTGEPELELFYEIYNGAAAARPLPFSILLNDRVTDADRLDVPAGARVQGFKRLLHTEGGVLSLRLDDADALMDDNQAFGVLPPPSKIPVVLVGEGNTFLEAALYADSHLSVRSLWPADWATHTPSAEAVYVFDRWAPGGEPVARGVYLGVAPGGTMGAAREPLSAPAITSWNEIHPVSRHLVSARMPIAQALVLNVGAGDTTLASSFTSPLIVARHTERETAILFGFDPSAGEWPLQVAYPLLLGDAIRSVAEHGGEDALPLYRVNDSVAPAAIAGLDGAGELRIAAPDGSIVIEAAAQRFSGGRIALDRPGVWYLERDGVSTPLLAVNVCNAGEAQNQPRAEAPLTGLAVEPSGVLEARSGVNPAWLLAAAGVALLCAEWFFFQRRWIE